MTPLELADKLEQLMQTTKVDYTVQEAADMIRELHLKNRELQMRVDAMTARVEYL
jgi:hypothetical protein